MRASALMLSKERRRSPEIQAVLQNPAVHINSCILFHQQMLSLLSVASGMYLPTFHSIQMLQELLRQLGVDVVFTSVVTKLEFWTGKELNFLWLDAPSVVTERQLIELHSPDTPAGAHVVRWIRDKVTTGALSPELRYAHCIVDRIPADFVLTPFTTINVSRCAASGFALEIQYGRERLRITEVDLRLMQRWQEHLASALRAVAKSRVTAESEIHKAARDLDVSSVQTLLKANPDCCFERSADNQLPLHYALRDALAEPAERIKLRTAITRALLLGREGRDRQQQLLWPSDSATLPVWHALALVKSFDGSVARNGPAIEAAFELLHVLLVESGVVEQIVALSGARQRSLLAMCADAVSDHTVEKLVSLLRTLCALYPAVFRAAVLSVDADGQSPLNALICNKQNVSLPLMLPLAELLFDPSLLDRADRNGYLPLHYAAANRSGAVLIDLLSEPAGSVPMLRHDGSWSSVPFLARRSEPRGQTRDQHGHTPWELSASHPAVRAAVCEWIVAHYGMPDVNPGLAFCALIGADPAEVKNAAV